MKVISVNISKPKIVTWRGKEVKTGIFKVPVSSISLKKDRVENDAVIDLRYHGGEDKACYLYSADHYTYWKGLYPELEWNYGMFGENISVEGLNESNIKIGDVFKIGEAIVQVVQPRQPCFKLGIRFGTQKIVKDFLNSSFPGVYCRVLQEGEVKKGDSMLLEKSNCGSLSVADTYSLFSSNKKNKMLLKMALKEEFLAGSCKSDFTKMLEKL